MPTELIYCTCVDWHVNRTREKISWVLCADYLDWFEKSLLAKIWPLRKRNFSIRLSNNCLPKREPNGDLYTQFMTKWRDSSKKLWISLRQRQLIKNKVPIKMQKRNRKLRANKRAQELKDLEIQERIQNLHKRQKNKFWWNWNWFWLRSEKLKKKYVSCAKRYMLKPKDCFYLLRQYKIASFISKWLLMRLGIWHN